MSDLDPMRHDGAAGLRLGPRVTVALLCAVNLLAGIVLGVAGQQLGRGGPGLRRGGPPRDPAEMLAARLGLDAAQADAARGVLARHEPEFGAIDRARREQLSALRDRIDAELAQILTPEQYQQLLALRAELERGERRGPPGGPHGGGPPRGPDGPGGPPGGHGPGGPGGPPPPPRDGPR